MMRAGLLAAAASLLLAPVAQAQGVFAVASASEAVVAWSARRDLLWIASQATALLLPTVLLFSGLGARLRRRVDRLTRGRRLLTASLCAGVYATLFVVGSLPVEAARQLLARPFGLGAADLPSWAAAEAQGALPLVAGALLVGWLPYLLFSRSPRLWPVWSALALSAVLVAALIVQPRQHDLAPLRDPRLQATVATFAQKAGSPTPAVMIRKAERAGPCGGATTLGLGPTKVIAIDTGLLRHHPEAEVAQAIAHELGHYVRGHDWAALIVGLGLIGAGVGVLRFGSAWAIRRGARRFGFDDLADPASLPLLVVIGVLFSVPASGAFHAYGRHLEEATDLFSLELTRDGEAQAALMQRYLRCSRWSDPDTTWIQRTFRQNHPSFRSRIAVASQYAAGVSASLPPDLRP